jgi:hypothetical protein
MCSFSAMENDKYRQPTTKHRLIPSLLSKQNFLISSEALHCSVNLFMVSCNTNSGKIRLRMELIRFWGNYKFVNR